MIRYEKRDTPNYGADIFSPSFWFKIHVGPDTSTPLPVSPLFTTVGPPLLDYSGIASDDADSFARMAYTAARVSVNAAFYFAAAATFTIADQLLALFDTSTYQ